MSQLVNSIPRLSRTREWTARAVAFIALAYSLYWITWRWTSTINWHAPVFSLTLLLAETFGVVSSILFVLTVWRLERREPPAAEPGHTVDVFITTYNEPLLLIRRTAIGARAIRYPHQTWVLDDGKRPEVEAMCEELGIGYIKREGNAHAKAGNLNNALAHTSGEFILQLDADHVPLPNILDRLLGYFTDGKVAFVQSPQDFYNTDSFTHVVNDEGRRVWEENRLFFSLIQPGKDTMNAAFFCGSCGVLRRAALAEIGGFSTRTITEDMETSMVLHARGWKSAYHGETLAYGLAPSSAGQYHTQRLRWGQGAMQIMRQMNPLFMRGLDWKQKLSYLASVMVYLDGVQRIVFYLAPVVFFMTGMLPVQVDPHALLVRLVPYILLTIVSFELLARGTGYILIAERYNMTRFFTYIMAVSAFFTRKPLKFKVTPKTTGEAPLGTYLPQLVLAALIVIALAWATFANARGWVNYHAPGWGSSAFIVNTVWLLWNLWFAVDVVRHSRQSRQERSDFRFVEHQPVRVSVLEGDVENGCPGEGCVATTNDINPSGLSFRSTTHLPPTTRVELTLALAPGPVTVQGHVLHVRPEKTECGTVWLHGIAFDELPLAARDVIELHGAHHSIPLWRQRYRQSIDPVANFVERFMNPRSGRRRYVGLPATVVLDDADPIDASTGTHDAASAILEDVSDDGARLLMENLPPRGAIVRYGVPGTTFTGTGRVVFTRALESPLRARYVVGVRRDREPTRLSRVVSRFVTPARGSASITR